MKFMLCEGKWCRRTIRPWKQKKGNLWWIKLEAIIMYLCIQVWDENIWDGYNQPCDSALAYIYICTWCIGMPFMGGIKYIIGLNIYMHTRPHEKISVACIRLEASILMPLSWFRQSAKRECGLICWVDAWFHMYVTLMSNV